MFFQYKIDKKIKDDSLEYQSMIDTNKQDSFVNIIQQRLDPLLKSSFIANPSPRVYNIPFEELRIIHQKSAVVGFDGSVFIHHKYFKQARHTKLIENIYMYVEELSLFKLKSLRDLKNIIKKIYFSYISPTSYKKRRILNDPSIAKILYFETAYDNMYHFLFQYYPTLLKLLEYCDRHKIDYYIIMPPKCNRGLRTQQFYKGYINEIMNMEKISEEKKIYLDYQNFHVQNLYHTNFPIDNPKICLPAISKIQKYFYKNIFQNMSKRIYISRKKARRRFLVNEKEIQNILEKEYGFFTVYMEEWNLESKISLMLHADVVASIDGTSLINGYFSTQKQVKLIAFRVKDMTEWGPIISGMFPNLEYLPILADVVNEKKHDFYDNVWYTSNLYLKPEYLREKLKEYQIESQK